MSTNSVQTGDDGISGHRIVVGIDGSEVSMKALDWAAAEADRAGATLDIETAYEPGYEFITHDEVQHSMARLIDEATVRVRKAHPDLLTTNGTHEAAPAAVLIDASQGADLLVVGSRGAGGFKGLLLGSVSQKCSLHSHCPITIVR